MTPEAQRSVCVGRVTLWPRACKGGSRDALGFSSTLGNPDWRVCPACHADAGSQAGRARLEQLPLCHLQLQFRLDSWKMTVQAHRKPSK